MLELPPMLCSPKHEHADYILTQINYSLEYESLLCDGVQDEDSRRITTEAAQPA